MEVEREADGVLICNSRITKKDIIMEECINFAYWLNIQRLRETQYMDKEELREMYIYYLECLENGTYQELF